jgi:hypothetical protein
MPAVEPFTINVPDAVIEGTGARLSLERPTGRRRLELRHRPNLHARPLRPLDRRLRLARGGGG